MNQPPEIFDTELLARRRNRAAAHASQHDFLLNHVAEDLVERLQLIKRVFPIGVNLGAHHGLLARLLRQLPGVETIIDVERSAGLLELCGRPRVLADPEALPFAEASLDLVVSGLCLQLVNDLPGTLLQIRRALKPDGLFLAALLGGDTLTELRQSWLIAEDEIEGGASPRVAPFGDIRDIGGLLQRAGFALPVVDAERLTVTYASPLALMAEIKGMGASNMLAARRRKPVTRGLLAHAAEVYRRRFAGPDGRVPATFDILSITAWAPDESQPKPLRPGSAKMRLAAALGVEESATHRPETPGITKG